MSVNADALTSTWALTAYLSAAACISIFFVGPNFVTKVTRPYATLTYRDKKDQHSSGARYVAFVHAVVVTVLDLYAVFFSDLFDDSGFNKLSTQLIWRTSTLTNIALGISLGYFLCDAIIVAWYIPAMGGPEMVTHHISAFFSVFVTCYYKEAHMYTLALLATECTTPFINIRWLLEKMGWKQTAYYKANGLALLVSWVFVRILMFFWFYTHLFHRRDQLWRINWPVKYLLLTVPPMLTVLNLIWFQKIARGAFKVFLGGNSKQEPSWKAAHTNGNLADGHFAKTE